jgi:hypothetical protein
VLKKDLTWRFCIDYRHFNFITVKNRYPLPIIEELIDELSGAQWFTSLDLRAGDHQIRMQPGDEEKTAFKTQAVRGALLRSISWKDFPDPRMQIVSWW